MCSKTSEAEVIHNSRVENILLFNEIYGGKFLRVSKLSSNVSDLIITINDENQFGQYSKASSFLGVEGKIMIDVNIGRDRCGINPDKF